jgi:hypothetical protein
MKGRVGLGWAEVVGSRLAGPNRSMLLPVLELKARGMVSGCGKHGKVVPRIGSSVGEVEVLSTHYCMCMYNVCKGENFK